MPPNHRDFQLEQENQETLASINRYKHLIQAEYEKFQAAQTQGSKKRAMTEAQSLMSTLLLLEEKYRFMNPGYQAYSLPEFVLDAEIVE